MHQRIRPTPRIDLSLPTRRGCMLLEPQEEFYPPTYPGGPITTLTVELPGGPGGFGGRVLTGVVRDGFGAGFIPLASAGSTQRAVDFDVDWTAA